MHTGNFHVNNRLRRFAALSLLLLACFQIEAAAHQFQHIGLATDIVCDACVQLDRLDDVPVASESLPLIAGPARFGYKLTVDVVFKAAPSHFSARAPPAIRS
jgi:hypothetical protein